MNNVTSADALAMVAGDILLAVGDLVHGLPFVVVRFNLSYEADKSPIEYRLSDTYMA